MELIAILQSFWTITVMIIFLGIVFWAYSSKNKSDFDEAARQILDDDDEKSTLEKR